MGAEQTWIDRPQAVHARVELWFSDSTGHVASPWGGGFGRSFGGEEAN